MDYLFLSFQTLALTNLITNLTNFSSPTTIIYAVTTQSDCNSLPIPITLTVVPNDPALYGMNILQDALCEFGPMTIQFTLPGTAVYTYNYELNCTSGNQNNSITTSANPIFLAVTSDCTLNITSITNVATACTTIFSPPLTDNIIVNAPPQITTSPMQICPGASINLADFVSTTSGASLTFHSASPPTPANQLSTSIVSPTGTTQYFALSILNDCEDLETLLVIVLPGGVPFTSTLSVCENGTIVNLNPYVTPATLTGSWSGPGVNGTTFNPDGLSGQVVLEFNPDNICYDTGTLTVDVTPDQVLALSPADICSSDIPLDLNTLEDPTVTNGTWSGPGVSGSFFNPALASGNMVLTFTPSNICISPATTTVNVLPAPIPNLEPNIVVCQGETIQLTDYVINPSGFDINIYANLPAIPFNEVINTNVTIFNNTQFYVKITDADGCFGLAPLIITATPGGVPNLGTATLCQTQTSFDLNTLDDPLSGPGIWSGPGVNSNMLDLNFQSGVINLTFIPDNACFSTTTTVVNVLSSIDPILGTDEVCSSSGNYNLSSLADVNFPLGTWSGQGVNSNIFNPSNNSGIITLTFDPIDFCVNDATTTIEVITSQTPDLEPLTVCETVATIYLNTLEDPLFTNGTWSGPGVTGNVFETNGLAGLILLTFTSSQNCIFPTNTTINVTTQQVPQLLPLTICEVSDPISLSAFTDPLYPSGIWTGPAVINGVFDPEGLSGAVILTFTSNTSCTLPSVIAANVTSAPSITNIDVTCDQTTKTYVVTFDITGGDANTYSVNGVAASANYTSVAFPSQSSYSFAINDANQCEIVNIQGSKNCDCITIAGTMNFTNTPLKACASGKVTALFNNDISLDNNDRLIFILHDNAGPSKGNVLATSRQPIFDFPQNGVLGTTYYISAVVADSLGLNDVNFSDACLSVAAGVPVVFYEPDIKINPTIDFCTTDCNDVDINTNGEGPFTFIIEISKGNTRLDLDTITTLTKDFKLPFCPSDYNDVSGLIKMKILNFNDKNCDGRLLADFIEFNVFPKRITNITTPICLGESITVNGNIYDENKPKGTEIINSSVLGQCDSIINVDLKLLMPSTFNFNRELCITQSIQVNNKVYDSFNPSGQEILLAGNVDGCDSIVNIQLTFTNEIINNLSQTLCKGAFINVNNKLYNESNPTGKEIISSPDGVKCDSVINVFLTFKSPEIESLIDVLCNGQSKVVNGITYNQSKPSGQEIVKNGASNGCDSIINVNLNFLPESKKLIVDTLCFGERIVINGETYDNTNQEGSFLFKNGSSAGCDSLVNVKISFYPIITDTIRKTIKRNETFTLNNVVFDVNNLRGLTTNVDLSATGCLQYTYVIIEIEQEFISADFNIEAESCPGENDGRIEVKAIKGCSNYIVTLQNNVIQNPVLPLIIENLVPGIYVLTISGNDNQCSYTETITISSSESEDFVVKNEFFDVLKGESILLDPIFSPLPDKIFWEPATYLNCVDCLTPEIKDAQESIEYTIYLTNIDGCVYSRKVSVNVSEIKNDIIFPNIFSPDGDGKNDEWTVLFTNNQQVNKLSIFDRWGNKVFNTTPTQDLTSISWNGNIGNQPVLPGVYIYMAEIKASDGSSSFVTGDVTVMK
ncbi:MAG: gliding motility-associated C-terminal domain-containing protein [Saprospiraceae bacterium]|nr:gliding motility-associated C-terminal domain-containing protein [Saprospiraceae bacterium]